MPEVRAPAQYKQHFQRRNDRVFIYVQPQTFFCLFLKYGINLFRLVDYGIHAYFQQLFFKVFYQFVAAVQIHKRQHGKTTETGRTQSGVFGKIEKSLAVVLFNGVEQLI